MTHRKDLLTVRVGDITVLHDDKSYAEYITSTYNVLSALAIELARLRAKAAALISVRATIIRQEAALLCAAEAEAL